LKEKIGKQPHFTTGAGAGAEELVSVITSGECWSDEGIVRVAASLSLEDWGSEAEVMVVASMFVEVGLFW